MKKIYFLLFLFTITGMVQAGNKNNTACPGTWTGSTGTDWFATSNWCDGNVPVSTTDVRIPAGLVNYPLIPAGIAFCQNLTVDAGATLTINGTAIININGSIINVAGIFDVSNGTLNLNFAGINFSGSYLKDKTVKNLFISNTATLGIPGGTDTLKVTNELKFLTAGNTLFTNDNLTIVSNAAGTASVADITGNSITGKVTVERWIHTGRKWRYVAVNTATTQTINQAFQERQAAGVNAVPGYGTIITDPAFSGTNGYDAASATTSIKYYDPVADNFVGLGNTNTFPVSSQNAYVIYVRGDRSILPPGAATSATTLRTSRPLLTGNQTFSITTAGQFAFIGNPYASRVDLRNLVMTGLSPFVYLWDPKKGANLGGYHTLIDIGNYAISNGGGGSIP